MPRRQTWGQPGTIGGSSRKLIACMLARFPCHPLSNSALDSVNFRDGHRVHETPLLESAARRSLFHPGERLWADGAPRRAVELRAYPEGRSHTRSEGLAA